MCNADARADSQRQLAAGKCIRRWCCRWHAATEPAAAPSQLPQRNAHLHGAGGRPHLGTPSGSHLASETFSKPCAASAPATEALDQRLLAPMKDTRVRVSAASAKANTPAGWRRCGGGRPGSERGAKLLCHAAGDALNAATAPCGTVGLLRQHSRARRRPTWLRSGMSSFICHLRMSTFLLQSDAVAPLL